MKKKSFLFTMVALFCVSILAGCKDNTGGGGGGGGDGGGDLPIDITLYHTVTFHENGGTPLTNEQKTTKVKSGEKLPAPTFTPIHGSANFDGWSLHVNGNTMWDFEKDIVQTDITLYAIWATFDEYESTLSEWSKPGHLYIHYRRFTNTEEDYKKWNLWLWPKTGEGVEAEWNRFDISGAVCEFDLTKKYTGAGRLGDATADFPGETDIGFLIVYKESKGQSGHWKSDGGNTYINNYRDHYRTDGSLHVFAFENKVPQFVYSYADSEDGEGQSDPYDGLAPMDGVSVVNVDSSERTSVNYPTAEGWEGTGYQIQICSFADSNGDGFGDINGITNNLDYIEEIGATTLWLTPVQLSNSYHGYDVIDFYQIDPKFGTSEDYQNLLNEAHKRGIKVLMDLVVNHTANNSVWFQKSTQLVSEDGIDYRSFFTWKHESEFDHIPNEGKQPWETEEPWYPYSNYGYYYYGKFASNMPELNYDYQGTRDAMVDVAKYWLDFGVDGFRIDAVKHIYMKDEYRSSDYGDTIHYETGYDRNVTKNVNYFNDFTNRVKAEFPDCFILGENFDGSDQNVADYYPSIDSQFDFATYYNLNRAVLKESTDENVESDNPGTGVGRQKLHQYAVEKWTAKMNNKYLVNSPFTSNHDVPRSMNSMLGGDVDQHVTSENASWVTNKNKLWTNVVMTLGGLSFAYYGDELGMSGNITRNTDRKPGDEEGLSYKDRWYRQPMKWEKEKTDQTIGFDFETYTIEWDDYNKTVNGVKEQRADANSSMNNFKSIANLRKNDDVLKKGSFIGWDAPPGLNPGGYNVMVFQRTYANKTYIIYHNLQGVDKTAAEYLHNHYTINKTVWSSNGSTTSLLKGHSTIILDVTLP